MARQVGPDGALPSSASVARHSADREDDDEASLYRPLRRWLDARPDRLLALVATGLVAIQVIVRLYVKIGTWYYIDDYAFIARADTLPFWSTDYLLKGWNGHFMPGSFAWVSFLNAFWHLNYTAVIVTDTVMQVIADLLLYRLLVSLFGVRPAILVPFTIYVLTPATLPAYLWWSASINQLPGQVALISALLLQVRYHRTGRLRYALLAAFAVLVGLMFSEKVLLAVPCLLALTLFYFTPGPPVQRIRRLFSRHWKMLVAYGAVALPYTFFYVTALPSPVDRHASIQDMVATSGNAVTHALLPALLGGPWHWQPALGLGAYADPSPAAVLFVSITAVVVVFWSMVRSHRAVFAWIVIAGYELVNTLLLGLSRTALFGPLIGSEYRYSTDAAIIAVVFGSMAFVQLRTDDGADRPQRLIPREPAPAAARFLDGRAEPTLVGAACCILAVSAIISTVRCQSLWRNTRGKPYFAAVEHDIRAAGRSIPVADEDIGARVQGGLLLAYNSPSSMFAGFHPTPTFLKPKTSTSQLFVADDSGNIRRAAIEGLGNKPGRQAGCGYRVSDAVLAIPLQNRTLPWRWTVRIGYLSTGDSDSTVTAGYISTNVHIRRGVNALFVMGFGDFATVDIGPLAEGVSLCTDDIQVGTAVPVPGTHP